MTDEELLAQAYKAAFHGAELSKDKDMQRHWNPLTNDGDALRLAVRLQMNVWCDSAAVSMAEPLKYISERASEVSGNDPYSATRRAIVRAAAAMIRP